MLHMFCFSTFFLDEVVTVYRLSMMVDVIERVTFRRPLLRFRLAELCRTQVLID